MSYLVGTQLIIIIILLIINSFYIALTHNKQYTFYEKMEIKHYNLITVQELVHWAMPNKTKKVFNLEFG